MISEVWLLINRMTPRHWYQLLHKIHEWIPVGQATLPNTPCRIWVARRWRHISNVNKWRIMFRGVTSAHCFLSSACYCMNCDGWELLQTCITGGNRGRQNFMVTGIVLVAKRQEQYVVSKQLVKTHYNRLYGHSLINYNNQFFVFIFSLF